MDFGPGGAWGEDLYVAGREPVGRGDGPYRLWRIDGSGNGTEFTVTSSGAEVRGIWKVEFDRSTVPAVLYVGTDADSLDPGTDPGLYRVASTGQATLLYRDPWVVGVGMTLGGGPDLSESLFTTTVMRLDWRTNDLTLFAEGLTAGNDITLGPDGALYVSQGPPARILRITPCP